MLVQSLAVTWVLSAELPRTVPARYRPSRLAVGSLYQPRRVTVRGPPGPPIILVQLWRNRYRRRTQTAIKQPDYYRDEGIRSEQEVVRALEGHNRSRRLDRVPVDQVELTDVIRAIIEVNGHT